MGLKRPALVLVGAALGHALCWTAEQPNCDYALATLATKPTLRELELFLRTLRRFDATRKVYVGTDSVASDWTRKQRIYAVDDTPCLARYEAFSRNRMKQQRWGDLTIWTHLQLEKTTIMARALDDGWAGVLYADCDVVWLAPLPPVGPGVLGVSPCLCAPRVEVKYGKYNGGHVFVRRREVLAVWRNATRRSRYFEQAALETIRAVFKESAFDLDRRANVEWLNLLGSHSFDRRDHTMNLTVDDDGKAWWLGDRLLSIHAHVVPSSNQPNFQLPAVARITAVLQHSLILDDLCTTHYLLCASLTPCPVDAFRGRSRTTHIASFRAGHGDAASNYYHFFFGLLVPFLKTWTQRGRQAQIFAAADTSCRSGEMRAGRCRRGVDAQRQRCDGAPRNAFQRSRLVHPRRHFAAPRAPAGMGPRLAPLRVQLLLDRGKAGACAACRRRLADDAARVRVRS